MKSVGTCEECGRTLYVNHHGYCKKCNKTLTNEDLEEKPDE